MEKEKRNRLSILIQEELDEINGLAEDSWNGPEKYFIEAMYEISLKLEQLNKRIAKEMLDSFK